MTEREWQRQVIQLARGYGWEVFHVGDSRRQLKSGKLVGDRQIAGFPDLTLVHPSRGFVFAELKSDTGKPTERQIEVLDLLATASRAAMAKVAVQLWRPRDLDDRVIPLLAGTGGDRLGGW
ncbi:MAG: hypothetical protein ACOYOQ_00295 [Microthrixaceae bacterium]